LGDAGQRALIEFVGERDRVRSRRRTAPVVSDESQAEAVEESQAAAVEEAVTEETGTEKEKE
jgi:large subunit ribosomal protein L17